MAKLFSILQDQLFEVRARERYFLETGQEFYELSPTEQRTRWEAELERASERNISFDPSGNGLPGSPDLQKPQA